MRIQAASRLIAPSIQAVGRPALPRITSYNVCYTKLLRRQVVDLILDRTRALHDAGHEKEVLTVDNHADGPYTYFRLLKEDPKRAEEVMELLQYNEGNNS